MCAHSYQSPALLLCLSPLDLDSAVPLDRAAEFQLLSFQQKLLQFKENQNASPCHSGCPLALRCFSIVPGTTQICASHTALLLLLQISTSSPSLCARQESPSCGKRDGEWPWFQKEVHTVQQKKFFSTFPKPDCIVCVCKTPDVTGLIGFPLDRNQFYCI